MANTLRQIVSNIRGIDKLLSSDILISDRLVAAQVRNVANTLVTRSLDKRKLWSSPNVFTPILCLEMEEVPLTQCCEYFGDKKVAKSVLPLPKIGEGIWGLAIQLVSGVDNLKRFKETTATRYANLLKMKISNNDVYYWIHNNHLFISNPDTRKANIYGYFTEDVPNNLLYPGEDCDCANKPSLDDLCKNPLDKNFYFPANYIEELERIVLDKLNRTFDRKKEQVTSDNQEGN